MLKNKIIATIGLWRPIFYGHCSSIEKEEYADEIIKLIKLDRKREWKEIEGLVRFLRKNNDMVKDSKFGYRMALNDILDWLKERTEP